MPLHHVRKPGQRRHAASDDIYTAAVLGAALPRDRFPKQEAAGDQVYAALRDELLLDGNSRQNLATFCQTWVEPEIRKLMDDCIDKNMIDKEEYPQTAEIEARCVHMLADLWNAPDSSTHHRLFDDRLERSGHARRFGAQMELARAAPAARASRPNGPI